MTTPHVREIWRYPVKSMSGERLENALIEANGIVGDRWWAVRDDMTGEIYNAKRFPKLMQCHAKYREPPRTGYIPGVDVTFPDGAVVGTDSSDLSERLSELMRRRVSLHQLEPASNIAYYRRRETGASVIGRLARYRRARQMLMWTAEKTSIGDVLRQDFGREKGERLPDLSDIPAETFQFYTPPGTYFDVYPIHLLTTSTLDAMARLNADARWDVRRFRPNVLVDTGEPADAELERRWTGRVVTVGTVLLNAEIPTVRCAMPTHAQADLPPDPSVLRTIVRQADQCLGIYATVAVPGSISLMDRVDVS